MKSLFIVGASALFLAGAVSLGITTAERIHLGFALPADEELDIYQHSERVLPRKRRLQTFVRRLVPKYPGQLP